MFKATFLLEYIATQKDEAYTKFNHLSLTHSVYFKLKLEKTQMLLKN